MRGDWTGKPGSRVSNAAWSGGIFEMVELKPRPGVVALAILFAHPALAAGDPRAADRAAIIAGERAWGQAYVTGNVATVRRLLADDFRGIDTRGRAYDKARA